MSNFPCQPDVNMFKRPALQNLNAKAKHNTHSNFNTKHSRPVKKVVDVGVVVGCCRGCGVVAVVVVVAAAIVDCVNT